MKSVASADGTVIAYEQQGSGPALIIVDGAMSTRGGKAALRALLAPQLTVFGYNRRGRGDSGDTLPYAVDREIEDIRALIEVAGGTAALYGHSSGAALALDAALHLGNSVSKGAMYEPPCNDDPRRPAGVAPLPRAADRGAGSGPPRGRGGAVHGLRRDPGPAGQIDGMREQGFWPAMAALGPTLAYDHTASSGSPWTRWRSRPSARSWPCRPSRCRSPAWRIASMPASATTGFLGADAGGVDEPDPPVHCRSAPPARRPGGGPTLADRVRDRAECDRDGDRGAGPAGHADPGGRDCGGPGGPALDTPPSSLGWAGLRAR